MWLQESLSNAGYIQAARSEDKIIVKEWMLQKRQPVVAVVVATFDHGKLEKQMEALDSTSMQKKKRGNGITCG